jgi:quercetin dioxygenase-like cupin family protein
MADLISFGPGFRHPAPARWGCTHLEATPILTEPLMVEHHYAPGGEMHEHPAGEAVLCVCIGGRGFVKVGDDTSELHAHQAVVWPVGLTHKLWTTDSSLTVLLLHFPGRETLTPAHAEWRTPAPEEQ